MIKALVATALLSVALAFKPAGRAAMSTLRMGFTSGPLAGLAGADGPESKNFDPAKFAESSAEWIPFFREAELKHGRIAMLATAGYLAVDLGITLPDHSGSSFAAHAASVSSGALLQVLIFTSIIEICTIKAVEGLKDGSRKPGDYSFDPLGFSKTPAARAKYEVNELKNGRLAMLAFSGIVTQDGLGHHGFPYL